MTPVACVPDDGVDDFRPRRLRHCVAHAVYNMQFGRRYCIGGCLTVSRRNERIGIAVNDQGRRFNGAEFFFPAPGCDDGCRRSGQQSQFNEAIFT